MHLVCKKNSEGEQRNHGIRYIRSTMKYGTKRRFLFFLKRKFFTHSFDLTINSVLLEEQKWQKSKIKKNTVLVF